VPDSAREIENLVYAYAERIDAGDYAGVAELFEKKKIRAFGISNYASWQILEIFHLCDAHGMPRQNLADACAECDVYFNLSNMNWIPEFELCRRRILVDTDPAFTQIGFGMGGPFSRYQRLFTYGENVHNRTSMPTAGQNWLPTRQPVVLSQWKMNHGDPTKPITTIMNWSSYPDREFEGRVFGQKNREFPPYYDLPQETQVSMEMAIGGPGVVISPALRARTPP